MADDLLTRLRAAWNTLTPEERAYILATTPVPVPPFPTVDPKITETELVGHSNEYPTIDSFDCDRTLMLLAKGHDGTKNLCTGDGKVLYAAPASTSSNALWHRTEPKSFYRVYNNVFQKIELGDAQGKHKIIPIRTFSEFAVSGPFNTLSTMGEEDLSDDGTCLAFRGIKPDGNEVVFRYDISRDAKSKEVNVTGRTLDQIYMTPDNNVLLGFKVEGKTPGVELYDKDMNFVRWVTKTPAPHMDVCRNPQGDEVMIRSNDATMQVLVTRLRDGSTTLLPASGTWDVAIHVSCPMNKPWFLVETYNPKDGNDPRPSHNAILKYGFDGTMVILRKHGSFAFDYEHQPKTSVSHDGSRMVYTVNDSKVVIAPI